MPDAADTKQIRDLVVKYLDDNPATRAEAAAGLNCPSGHKELGIPSEVAQVCDVADRGGAVERSEYGRS
jgi:hypothetical protein